MSRRRPPALKLLTIAILAVLPALSAQAQQQDRGRGNGPPQRDRGQQDGSSLSDAVRRVERDTRGEVLSAERVQYDGRDMHRVKVVDDQGRVRVFMQDPRRRDDNDSGNNSGNNNRGQNRRSPPPSSHDDDD